MKNIFRKITYIILMVTMIITSFTPYSGKAESYTGDHNQISDAGGTVSAENGNVIISKNIMRNNEENYFDIELTVKTTKLVSSIEIPQDLAIVLVLDTSNSMSQKNMIAPDGTTKSRLNVLKDALRQNGGFIDQFVTAAEQALTKQPGTVRELAVVSFNHKATTERVLTKYTKGSTNFASNFKSTINNLATGLGTAPAVGLMRAREILAQSTAQNKYIVFLTDGYPTAECGTSNNGYKYTSSTDCPYKTGYGSYNDLAAMQATEQAILNKEAGIKTYSIGVGVDGESTYTNESSGKTSKNKDYNTKYEILKQYPDRYIVGYKNEVKTTTTITGNTTITLDELDKLDLVISNTNKTQALYSNGISRNDLNNSENLWTFEKNDDGTYYIKYKNSNNTSNYLSIDHTGNGISLRNQSQAGKFNVTKNTNGSYTISYLMPAYTTNGECIRWGLISCREYEKINHPEHTRYIIYNNGWIASDTEGNVALSQLNTKVTETPTGNRITGPEQFKHWLGGQAIYGDDKTSVGISANVTRGKDTGYGIGYYDVSDGTGLQNAYDAIFDGIRKDMEELAEAWTVRDPMNYDEGAAVTGFKVGDFAQFVNFYETSETGYGARLLDNDGNPIYENHNEVGVGKVDNEVQFDSTTNRILWDLKKSDYVKAETTKIDNVLQTQYTYRLTYRVRLMNENTDADHLFDGSTTYSTNGKAELDYVFVEDGSITKRGTIDFPNPIVIGKSNGFKFNKLSGYSNINLNGAKFKVYLNKDGDNTVKMFKEASHISEDFEIIVESVNGEVTFMNIPSGYDYIMEEVTPPQGYAESMVGPFGPINDLETAKGYGYTEGIFNNENDGSQKYYFTIIDGNITYTSVPNTIYNFPEYKKLVIRKEVKPNDESNQNAYIDNDKEFSFTITVDDSIANHYDAIKNNETISIKLKNKVGSFKLKNNEEIEIYIPYGVHYEIEEKEHNGYTVTYDGNEEGYIELTNEKVVVTNKKEPTNIKVKKVWKNTSDYVTYPKVEVTLQRSLDNKTWEDVKDNKGNVLKATIDTSVKDYAEWNNLDGDYAYRVIETNIIGEDPEIFNVDYKFDESTGTWTITNTDTRIVVLPEAGSSGGLILASLAFVFITMPVMYTAYNLYIDKRWF